MTCSQSIAKIAPALVKAQMEMGNAIKDAVNPFFKKSYADLNSVREASLPILNKYGISVLQPTCFIENIPFVETILLHESGEFISSLTQIVVDKINDAQRHGSGLSYARRYALSSIINIGAEDDDAEKAKPKLASEPPPAIPPAPPPAIPPAPPAPEFKVKKATQLEIKAAENNLKNAADVDFSTFRAAWVEVPDNVKPAVLAFKDKLKEKFNKPAATPA